MNKEELLYPESFSGFHSYTGNALACALAVEVLNIFEEEHILERLKPKMALLDSYAQKFEGLPEVGEFRRCGMVAAVEMVQDKQRKTPYPWQQRRGCGVYQKALQMGALLRPLGNVIYFMPPLTIDESTVEELLEIAFRSIVAMRN